MSTEQQAQASAAAATTTTAEAGLLDQIIQATRPQDNTDIRRAKDNFREFLDQAVAMKGKAVSKNVEAQIKFWIGAIDKKLTAQLNEVMHNKDFQKLESTWRGLHYLVHQSETGEGLKVRVLNVSKKELFKDLEKAAEFDQSTLFKKMYEEEFGQLGGKPYGMIVGDFEFGRSAEDISLLEMVSHVAAACHAPFVAAASAKMFNLQSYSELSKPRDMAKIFEGVEYAAWKAFRESEDSRYVALAMPRVLSRLPYGKDFKAVAEFNYEEAVDGTDPEKYAWMNAAWAYATRMTDAYSKYGWFSRTRGVEGGGKVEGLPVHTFPTDDGTVAMKCPTEIAISDRREFELSSLGFLPLIHSKDTNFAVFMGSQSCQKPKAYFDKAANANAELSAKFNLLMCNSRFAHYLKVMARDKIGSFMTADDCSRWLNNWIKNYCVDPAGASDSTKAMYPLSDASVNVQEVAGKPGWYEAVAYLKPHYQMETLTTSMRLVASVPK